MIETPKFRSLVLPLFVIAAMLHGIIDAQIREYRIHLAGR